MALLEFGGGPIRATGIGGSPDEWVLDLGLYFASATLAAKLIAFTATGASPSVSIEIQTSMDPKGDDANWVTVATFDPLTDADPLVKVTATDLLRYVRWYVKTLTNADAVTFTLRGVARNP